MNKIDNIASTHLGKSSDGKLHKVYSTPDSKDKSLLVRIPRSLNRVQYVIKENKLPFVGYDVWNCYEISFLLYNGYPVNCVAKIIISSNSPNIVESKSLKLYLNSFNMDTWGKDINSAVEKVRQTICKDLNDIISDEVKVYLFINIRNEYDPFGDKNYDVLEDFICIEDVKFNSKSESPDLLAPNYSDETKLSVCTNTLRSNCRVTNQPDWGDVYIYMNAEEIPSYVSLLQYIVSMRSENHFHEEICECIYKRLWDRFKPDDLLVCCLYTRRGGIDINPVRASSNDLLIDQVENMLSNKPIKKTMRQ